MDLELKDKVAVITGGSRGIGKAIGRELAKEGAKVALVARDMAALEAAAADIARDGKGTVKGFRGDTGDDASVKSMVAEVMAAFGRIDILVNCAAKPSGQGKPTPASELGGEEFWDHMNTKVMGYIRTAREVAPHMVRQGSGRIINISGLGARQTGTAIGTIRNVSVAAFTKNLADELGPKGVSVVCVHPGLTRTEATPGVIERGSKNQGISPADFEKRLAGTNVLKRLITAEEIAYVCAFLASPKSVAINGDSVAAGGGAPNSIFY